MIVNKEIPRFVATRGARCKAGHLACVCPNPWRAPPVVEVPEVNLPLVTARSEVADGRVEAHPANSTAAVEGDGEEDKNVEASGLESTMDEGCEREGKVDENVESCEVDIGEESCEEDYSDSEASDERFASLDVVDEGSSVNKQSNSIVASNSNVEAAAAVAGVINNSPLNKVNSNVVINNSSTNEVNKNVLSKWVIQSNAAIAEASKCHAREDILAPSTQPAAGKRSATKKNRSTPYRFWHSNDG
ncbi:hypothetical protein AWC38_SpisGene18826 [Stylophora pistillata]|uniref:Uncharacterized protein n=1 Tax=Stylophora pistillata TaxID=50429 RepID=A0A2B4RI62_STYPI|nr:hypothetical protein AWC38_SpisGene18826 [Stylophora pistillata]